MLHTFSTQKWDGAFPTGSQSHAMQSLESGSILYFPHLAFSLKAEEALFLSPDFADPHAKNISYQANCQKLWGVQHLSDEQHMTLKHMLDRFCQYAIGLVHNLFPSYSQKLIVARTSYRPVQISGRKTSYRKDDKRLHVDAFPSAPNQGNRILRVFCNINPHGIDRIWRVGEPFEKVVDQFAGQLRQPLPGSAALLRLLRITKSYRTLYDHYMLSIHDRMKADTDYQKNADQQIIHFPANSAWIVQTDQVSHAAMQGQYALEQTFYLPVQAMQDETKSPLRILEKMLNQKLV